MRVYNMDHGLKHISFCVQKRVVAMGMCFNPALVPDKLLGVPTSVKQVYYHNVAPWCSQWNIDVSGITFIVVLDSGFSLLISKPYIT